MSGLIVQRIVNLAIGVLLAAGLILAVNVIYEQTQPVSEVHGPAGHGE